MPRQLTDREADMVFDIGKLAAEKAMESLIMATSVLPDNAMRLTATIMTLALIQAKAEGIFAMYPQLRDVHNEILASQMKAQAQSLSELISAMKGR